MTAPLVSVVVPTYNRAQMAGQAVASALAQTFGDLEVIVVDDGSDDDTPGIVADLCARDPRVRLVRLAHTGMPGLVRNRGVDVASGLYVAFLDSDDLWKRRKLERQLAALRAAASTDTPEPARLCHTRETWLREGRVVRQPPAFDNRGGDLFVRSLDRCIIGPSTVVVERRLFGAYGGFREDLQVAEDYEFWLRITARESVAYVEEPLVLKRAGGWDQLSERYGQIDIFRIRALAELLCDRGLPSGAPAEAAGEAFRRTCARYAHGRRKRGDEASAALFDRLSEVDSAPSEEDLRALRAFECEVRIRVSATMVRPPAVLGQ